ncbi:MAG: hypothetical protein ACRDUA_11050 [Micromonosporaceae bacterium]
MGTTTITINGVDRTNAVELTSLTIRETLRGRGSTAEFTYRTVNNSPARPEGGNEIVISNGDQKEFAGHLMVPAFAMWRDEAGNFGHDFACQCVDYGWELDKFLVYDRGTGQAKSYPAQAGGTTIADLVDTYADGRFSTAGVETGFTAQAQEFDVVPLTEAIERVARETGFLWHVDYDRQVNYYAVESLLAPVPLIDLDADARFFNVEGESGDVSQVRNPILLKDVELRDAVTIDEHFTGNGVSRFFPLNYPPSPATADFDVLMGGTWETRFDEQSGLTPTDGTTASGTAFLCVFNKGCRLGSAPPNGQVFTARYNRMVPRLAWYSDPAAIAEMAARENQPRGEHEHVVNLPAVAAASEDTIEAMARLHLSIGARARVRLRCATHVNGWRRGQYAQVVSAGLGLNRRLYVHDVTKRVLNETTWAYELGFLDHLHGDD